MAILNNSNKNNDNIVLNFKIDNFDGPFDLLVELIKEKKMDILTIDIGELSSQYLDFVNANLLRLPIDNISQYLVMASYLTELKTKMLIPMLMGDDELYETELEIDRLRRRLFLYKQYKDIVGEFRLRQSIRTKYISKACDDLDEFIPDDIPEAPLPNRIPIDKLVKAWQKIALNLRNDEIDKTFTIKVSNIDVDEIQKNVFTFIDKNNTLQEIAFNMFINMFDKRAHDIEYRCAIFVSLLVLAKDGYIIMKQPDFNSTIYISKNNDKIEDIENEDVKQIVLEHNKLSKTLEQELKQSNKSNLSKKW